MKTLILVLILIFVTFNFILLESEEIKAEDKTKTILNEVMNEICKNKYKSGFEKLKSINGFMDASEFDLTSAKLELPDAKFDKKYSNGDSYEFISRVTIGNSIAKYIYIQKFDQAPLVWDFTVYKKNDTWQIISFNRSVKYQEVFK